jgi:hypothetical protein
MWKGIQGKGSVRCPHGDPSNERMPSLREKVSKKTGQFNLIIKQSSIF